MEELFEDFIHLSNFIMTKNGALPEGTSLEKIFKESRSGRSGPNDQPTLWLQRVLSALDEELHELKESIAWKWWKREGTNLQNVRVEIVDMLHFLILAAYVSGMSGTDLARVLYEKRRLNYDRQIKGSWSSDDNASIGQDLVGP